MRQYEFAADADTVAALRMLGRPWAQCSASEYCVDVRLASGELVRISADGDDLEPMFECFRIHARIFGDHDVRDRDDVCSEGAARVTLLRSEQWLTAPDGTEPTDLVGELVYNQGRGKPGSRPWSALAACEVDDGVLIVAGDGRHLLIRCATMPTTIDITRDTMAIGQWLMGCDLTELVGEDT